MKEIWHHLTVGNLTPLMETQMEKKMDHAMEAWYVRGWQQFCSADAIIVTNIVLRSMLQGNLDT